MTDFMDQYAAQFRAAAAAETSRSRRAPLIPLGVAGLAAAAIAANVIVTGPDELVGETERVRPLTPASGYAQQRDLLGVLRKPTAKDRDPQVRQTVRDYGELKPREGRLLGKAASGSAYVLLATREYREVTQPPPPYEPDDEPTIRTHRDGVCLVRRGTEGGAGACFGTEAIRAGYLLGSIAGEVYGVVPDGVTHVVPPRGRPPVRVRRNFFRYPARGYPGPSPIWLNASGREVPKVSHDGELPFLNYSGFGGLREHRGIAVVGLWASWCRPCEEQLRVLQQLHERVAERGDVEVLGVATKDESADAVRTLERLGVRFPVLSDPRGREADRLGARAFPETFVLSPEGKVLATFRGIASLEQLEEAVSRAR